MMKPRDIGLALFVAAIWGVNFVVIRVGLGSFPPLLLAALRFVVAALPAVLLPRPKVPLGRFLLIGGTLFIAQFAFLFIGMAKGMPPGLASVVLQSQAFMTMLVAAAVLRERPTPRQMLGTLTAFAGLAVIASTAGSVDVTMIGLVLCLAAALCWAVGNVALRSAGPVDMLAMMVWLSLVPPLPLFALALVVDGPDAVGRALIAMDLPGIGAVLYIALLSTLVGFAIWGDLLKRYTTATVAPFSLLVPIFGAGSASLLLGERFGEARLIGMALVLAGLAIVVLPVQRWIGGLVPRRS
ncbi:EamA family transporter [Mangrovicella endophytica]|uniref:EamA family transporter n=1 Tax=Mangrovicella endophytica TaxID=2066697 RepID=UPI001FE02D50|nr:EamA family transporter [Mangrovicella endophytica]